MKNKGEINVDYGHNLQTDLLFQIFHHPLLSRLFPAKFFQTIYSSVKF